MLSLPSLPSRERGLKCARSPMEFFDCSSLPSRERGLKLFNPKHLLKAVGRSLPSRERGLKYCGMERWERGSNVAPFAGAWIEIRCMSAASRSTWSLPSRERGLKFEKCTFEQVPKKSLPSRERGLKFRRARCCLKRHRASLPSRERGLKCRCKIYP